MAELYQLNMFGAPEPVSSYASKQGRGRHDDAPVPSERELLWPGDLARILGVPLLEKLYGDVPRRTRLKTDEICRRLRVDSNFVYDRIKRGIFDAVDLALETADSAEWRVYRYSIVSWLFNREFRDLSTRGARELDDAESDKIYEAIVYRQKKHKHHEE